MAARGAAAAKDTKMAAVKSGRPLRRELFALLGFQFRKPLEDEGVRLVGEFGDEREVVATVAVGVVVVLIPIERLSHWLVAECVANPARGTTVLKCRRRDQTQTPKPAPAG